MKNEKMVQFFKSDNIWAPEHYGFNFASVFLLVLATPIAILPWQIWNPREDIYLLFFTVLMVTLSAQMYLNRYIVFRENGVTKPIYTVLSHLPISKKEINSFRLRKLTRFCTIYSVIIWIISSILALAFFHTYSLMNIVEPFTVCFIIPMIAENITVIVRK